MFPLQGWGSREWVISFMVALVWITNFTWQLASLCYWSPWKIHMFSGRDHGQHPDDQGSVLGHTQQGDGGSQFWGGRCLCIAGVKQIPLIKKTKFFSGHSIWCAQPLDRYSWNRRYNFSSVRWTLIFISVQNREADKTAQLDTGWGWPPSLPRDFFLNDISWKKVDSFTAAQVWAWKIIWWIGWAGAFSDLVLLYWLIVKP